jgi:hypothetical protein
MPNPSGQERATAVIGGCNGRKSVGDESVSSIMGLAMVENRCRGKHMPRRLQRTRRKGARLPAEAVVVTRPTKWGNPHPLSAGRNEAVRRYGEDLLAGRLPVSVDDVRRDLRGSRSSLLLPTGWAVPRRPASRNRE